MERRADVAVVGGGIVGLAFAWEAARRGRSVVLFERSPVAQGASVRNFGMVWPIGQPAGEDYGRAMRSRARWLELRDQAGIWVAECGSLHLAHEEDEARVLGEFAARSADRGVACELLTASEAVRRAPAINPDGLVCALHSPAELAVDPRQAIARLPGFLAETHGVTLRFSTPVVAVEPPNVRTAAGETWHADRTFVCSGVDFGTLFPDAFAAAGLRRCKLQMMRTVPQLGGWRLGPHVAGGLTLGHYKAFEGCPSLPALKHRFADQMPEYVRYGIHVMAAQNAAGEVVIGDSHEYDADISPFDSPRIDELILAYLRRIVRLPDWAIDRRWHGEYAKHPNKPFVTLKPHPGCVIAVAPGGAGMTLSFGLAQDRWDEHP
ncbi:MAG: TIGR03364 family FAD-dependent oxidoreductase [Gemmataceae bacterium]